MTNSERLVAATKPCYRMQEINAGTGTATPGHPQCPAACECKGTGRVYVFPDSTGVRVRCLSLMHGSKAFDGTIFDDAKCSFCKGKRWIAATDGWVWWRAVEAVKELCWAGQLTKFIESWKDQWLLVDGDPEAAFFAALTRALEAMPGVQLGEG